MADFKQMYNSLFNAVTDTVENLFSAQQQAEQLFTGAANRLIAAQQKTEEMYTDADETPIHLDEPDRKEP